jgi:hypothetical protein
VFVVIAPFPNPEEVVPIVKLDALALSPTGIIVLVLCVVVAVDAALAWARVHTAGVPAAEPLKLTPHSMTRRLMVDGGASCIATFAPVA